MNVLNLLLYFYYIEHRVISKEQGKKLAQEYEFLFSECSIKSGNDLNFVLIQLSENIIKIIEYKIKKELMKYLSFEGLYLNLNI